MQTTALVCPQCKMIAAADAVFCPTCGAALHPDLADDNADRATWPTGVAPTSSPEPDVTDGKSSDTDSVFTRLGDPAEFDGELTTQIVDPGDPGQLDVPPGLLRQALADPVHVPELLAARAVAQLADRAQRDVRLLRERNPDATDLQLAVYFKLKYSRAARWEGAGTGTLGLLGLPADLVLLAWFQNKLVLTIAAI